MVVCVHLPRFELVIAAGGAGALAARPLAIAPTPGDRTCVGEVSGAAEAFGVERGMRLGEALARCPELGLVAADPLGVAQAWEETVRALEGMGACVELERAGLAYFEADGLRGLYGDEQGTIAAVRRRIGRPVRVGAGPTRFCALAAGLAVRSRRAEVVEARRASRYLAGQPVGLLRFRGETAGLVEPLSRLGIRTLSELAALARDALADRFGEPGVLAHRLACGEDTPLRPRQREDPVEEGMELGESRSGAALERVLGVLVERLLARPERRGRTLGAVTLSARLVEGGTWRERVIFRQALADGRRMRLALSLRLALLPAPAESLHLGVARFGLAEGRQIELLESDRQKIADPALGAVRPPARTVCPPAPPVAPSGRQARRERLQEAVCQMRELAGQDAALRALCVDPDSRVPERRVVLSAFSG
jgi:protein ImuB